MRSASQLLEDPLVLRAAWRRVRRWYQGADWVPQPEATVFELTADEQLPLIGSALASGTYVPEPFRLLAYPKGGGALRHYAVPTPRDQVAFTVLAVLLGPLIDLSIPSFAFGNRWYRALYRQRHPASTPRWRHRPFALDAAYFYQPYRRDFSLFRRSAHWAASVMVGRDLGKEEAVDKPFTREDFPENELPGCCQPDWWAPTSTRGYWARLDLRLAYPSVRVSLLGARMRGMLAVMSDAAIEAALAGYPHHVAQSLAKLDVRDELAVRLVAALDAVRYDASVVGDLWLPKHVSHDVPRAGRSEHPGIPTGLAFSGALLNCYLYDFDQRIQKWLLERPRGRRAAVLRFADDIIVLGQTDATIAETIDAVWQALEGRIPALLGSPNRERSSSNLRINWGKVEPEPLREKFGDYLADSGWARDKEELIEPPESLPGVLTFADWLRRHGATDWLDDFQIGRDRIGPFVTHLVERMSTLGGESLDDRFGRGARTRLDELHQLIRLHIDDAHVRVDTRLAFAANKMARAFLPNEGGPTDPLEVALIRDSIGEAVLRVPWKFSLWRSVVHGACRRPLIRNRTPEELVSEENDATAWLTRILLRVSASEQDAESWLRRWPEKKRPERPVAELYLAFLRASFWLALTASIRDLRRIAPTEESSSPKHWSSAAWTFRAVDEQRAPTVLAWLSGLDRWASVLYPADTMYELSWWEADALAAAALSITDAAAAVGASLLTAPDGSFEQPRVLALLRNAGRIAPVGGADGSAERWAHAVLAVRPHRRTALVTLATTLFESNRLRGLRWATSLGLLNFVEEGVGRALEHLHREVMQAPTLPKLEEYQRARRVTLAFFRGSSKAKKWTVHRLLWAVPADDGSAVLWPAAAPALGLPPRIALRMLMEAVNAEFGQRPATTPWAVWTLPAGAVLWNARRRQLLGEGWEPAGSIAKFVLLGASWDVKPHGAYFLPAAVAGVPVDPLLSRIWSHVLQFLTAAQGDESFLDQILAAWPLPAPLEERWALRADVPLSVAVWRAIDKAIAGALAADVALVRDAAQEIRSQASSVLTADVVRDFTWDRVDVKLSLDGGELPVGCVPFQMRPAAPAGDLALPEGLPKEITVTMAQVSAQPNWVKYRKDYAFGAPPPIRRHDRQLIMAQFAAAFASRTAVAPTTYPDGPIIFPEVTLPLEEEVPFRRQVLAQRRAALAGLHWKVLPFATTGNVNARPTPPTRFLVNEALLVVPVSHPADPGVFLARTFRIRKPLPTHVEHSLAASLGDPPPALGSEWRLLPGSRWYRFVHPTWGDFSVAICSDLLDPSPWKSLQGQILHLFLLSYNTDIQLYESLTWLRAYEAYTNVVATNHGHPGGSFAWMPASGESKEVARLRGSDLFLIADVRLKVESLARRQRTGVAAAINDGKRVWAKEEEENEKWKAPPPGYRNRR